MKTICAILATGTALALAAPASAQEAAPSATFKGPRVGVTLGYDKSRSGSSVDIDNTRDFKQSIDGLLYGGEIGYDMPVGNNLVVGAEAELTDSTAKWTAQGAQPNTFNLGRVSAGRDVYVGARVGYAMSPKTMLYVKGGYTNARYAMLASDGTTTLDQRIDLDGYRVGGGLEYAFSPKTFGRIEYRYSHYGKGELDFGGQTPDSSRFNVDTDRHQIAVTYGLRF